MTFNPNGPHDLQSEYAKETAGNLSPEDIEGLNISDYHPDDIFDNDEALEEYYQLLKQNEPYRQRALELLNELKDREDELIYSKDINRGTVRANNKDRLDLY